ncbi:coproporphyrinogen III oxidase [Bacillus piscicola]|uniref:coproporphyrinogen III oxidase n=1 Tax=Bacillus piscicola TaxID=1632684 RepID=UPI001F09BFE8|nr:coproporphyrinogen III oxidase [Bacillus piscicola]
MEIIVKGIAEKDLQALQHIADLYGLQAVLRIASSEKEEREITFSDTKDGDQLIYKAEFIHKNGEALTKTLTKPLSSPLPEKEQKSHAKHAHAYLLVRLLNEWTGTTQPWGILTGIRPVKLWHRYYQKGMNTSGIKDKLEKEYLVSASKTALLEQIAIRQQKVLPDLYELQRGVSIYIGIPFCPTKCAYCTFPAYAMSGRDGPVENFLTGLHYEMEQIGSVLTKLRVPVTTIYFGGGTPTSISAEQMDDLYAKMYDVLPMESVREITVEAGRPDTITEDKLQVLLKWNIDRISINPQTFTNETLETIGRHHSVEETIDKYELSRKMGMKNINMDLIIGLPGEGTKEMEHTLTETAKLLPESLTVHTLSFKRASKMTKQRERYQVADGEEIEKMMEITAEWMSSHHYQPYYLYRQKNILGNLENIGYSLPGEESLYNIIIMEEVQTIIGLGCGAASKWVDPKTKKISRYANPKDPVSYKNRYESCTENKVAVLTDMFSDLHMKAVPE